MKDDLAKLIERAKNALRGEQATAADLIALAKQLKTKHAFDYARRVFEKALPLVKADRERNCYVVQQIALCTSKDPDIPPEKRFRDSLQMLGSELARAADYLKAFKTPSGTADEDSDAAKQRNEIQETLGIAGGIYKRRWQVTGSRQDLLRSLDYYLDGYRLGVAHDNHQGYTAINAAFIHDLLAVQEEREVADPFDKGQRASEDAGPIKPAFEEAAKAARRHRDEAKVIRGHVIEALTPALQDAERRRASGEALAVADWWPLVTIAEAYFGLKDYKQAKNALILAAGIQVDPWEYEATVRQLTHLTRMTENSAKNGADAETCPAWEVLKAFVGADHVHGLRSAFAGKVGLALSGGGFRASFFHIGVLARLAELDLLRHVDVLSCVSGGSIVGAYYYLRLRNLLQKHAQSELSPRHYIELVEELEKDFTAFVQTNPRMRALANPWKCLKSIWFGAWRPTAVAQVLEEGLYRKAARETTCCCDRKRGPVPLCELFIQPKGESDEFQPRQDNWRRGHKAPMLVLNATTLNTGHNWQFTASWFGEPATGINTEVDGNERLRRMYYHEAPPAYRCMSLAQAAAASAAVPSIFWPVTFKGLYPQGRVVRLVDGGVFDNQGTTALLDEECTLLIVSDASGQLPAEADPSRLRVPTLFRSQSVFMQRIRGAEYNHLSTLHRAGLLRDFAFLHLKKDLESPPVDWVGCDNPKQPDHVDGAPLTSQRLTSYGIRADIQQLLSGIRTDLDAFCDVEAFALMTSGYRMASAYIGGAFFKLAAALPDPAPQWRFLEIQPLMQQTHGTHRFERLLKAASHLFFKCLLVHTLPKLLAFIDALIATVLILGLAGFFAGLSLAIFGRIAAAVAALPSIVFAWLLLGGASKLADFIYLAFGSIHRFEQDIHHMAASKPDADGHAPALANGASTRGT